jgi:glycosyltransferase involved in cell wall biosynthesis
MDGLEWKRSKWNFLTKKLMKYLEGLAVKRSHYMISDNAGIQQYYKDNYAKNSFLIAYGANVSEQPNKNYLTQFSVMPENYFILIARMEPENNIDVILQAFKNSGRKEPFLVIGNYETKYGKYLHKKFSNTQIKFLGSIYDKNILDSLRFYCKAYLHGHSVGGTNPSLLEAMASSAFIIAHKNPFNNSVLKLNALYFDTIENLCELYRSLDENLQPTKELFIQNNIAEINTHYRWKCIIEQHEKVFKEILLNNTSKL